MEQDNKLTHYFRLFWGLGLLLVHLITSDAKFYVIFVLIDPHFLY